MNLPGAGPRAQAQRAVQRINKEPGPGSFSQGPAPIAREGPSFSKALSLHGFLGGRQIQSLLAGGSGCGDTAGSQERHLSQLLGGAPPHGECHGHK